MSSTLELDVSVPPVHAEGIGKAAMEGAQQVGQMAVEGTVAGVGRMGALLASIAGMGGVAEGIAASTRSPDPMRADYRQEALAEATPVTPVKASQIQAPSQQTTIDQPPAFSQDVMKAALAATNGMTGYKPMEANHASEAMLSNLQAGQTPSRGMPSRDMGAGMAA